jgi:hypothetical protein
MVFFEKCLTVRPGVRTAGTELSPATNLDAAARRCCTPGAEQLRALVDTLGSCDKRALPFSLEPSAALPRSRLSPMPHLFFAGTFRLRTEPAAQVLRLGGRGVCRVGHLAVLHKMAKWIMCCAAAAQSVIDGVDRSSPTPKSSNCPHDGAHDEGRSAVRIHLFQ